MHHLSVSLRAAALSLAALSLAPCASAQSDAEVFNGVAKHLDLGGEFYGFLNIRGDYNRLAQSAEEFYQSLGGQLPLPPDLDVKGLLRELGFGNVTAMGASSVVDGEGFRNRAFVAVEGERQGLLKLAGGEPKSFVLPQWAPEKAVAGFEQELSLVAFKEVAEKVGAILEPSLGYNPADKIFGTEMPGIGLTIRAFLTNLTGRITGYAVLHEDRLLAFPEPMEIPAVDFVVRHDSGDWLFEPLRDLLQENLGDAAKETSGEGFRRLAVQLPEEQGLGFYQPVLHLDTATKHLFIASRPEALAEARNGGPRLSSNPRFAEATKDLPKEGNQMLWASEAFFAAYMKATMSLTSPGMGAEETYIQRLLMETFYGSPQDTASVMVNLPDGLYFEGVSSQSMKQTLIVLAVVPVAVVASVVTPVVTRTRGRAAEVRKMNEGRQLLVALTAYSGENGDRYPNTLQELAPRYLDEPALIAASENWLYLPGLRFSDRLSTPIIAAPANTRGQRLVGYLDGSVQSIPEDQFQEQWQAAREMVNGR